MGLGHQGVGHSHKLLVGPLAPVSALLRSSARNPPNVLLVSGHRLLVLVCLLVAFELGPVPEALPTAGAGMGPVTQMDTAVTAQPRRVTVGLVTERAAEGPLPEMRAPVVAEVPGVSEALPTLAAAVRCVGTVHKLVTVQVGALAETPATQVAQEGRPGLGCGQRGGPVRGPHGSRGWACPSTGKGPLVVPQPPSLFLKCLLPATCRGGGGGTQDSPREPSTSSPSGPGPPAPSRARRTCSLSLLNLTGYRQNGPLGFQIKSESTLKVESFNKSGGQNFSLYAHFSNSISSHFQYLTLPQHPQVTS